MVSNNTFNFFRIESEIDLYDLEPAFFLETLVNKVKSGSVLEENQDLYEYIEELDVSLNDFDPARIDPKSFSIENVIQIFHNIKYGATEIRDNKGFISHFLSTMSNPEVLQATSAFLSDEGEFIDFFNFLIKDLLPSKEFKIAAAQNPELLETLTAQIIGQYSIEQTALPICTFIANFIAESAKHHPELLDVIVNEIENLPENHEAKQAFLTGTQDEDSRLVSFEIQHLRQLQAAKQGAAPEDRHQFNRIISLYHYVIDNYSKADLKHYFENAEMGQEEDTQLPITRCESSLKAIKQAYELDGDIDTAIMAYVSIGVIQDQISSKGVPSYTLIRKSYEDNGANFIPLLSPESIVKIGLDHLKFFILYMAQSEYQVQNYIKGFETLLKDEEISSILEINADLRDQVHERLDEYRTMKPALTFIERIGALKNASGTRSCVKPFAHAGQDSKIEPDDTLETKPAPTKRTKSLSSASTLHN